MTTTRYAVVLMAGCLGALVAGDVLAQGAAGGGVSDELFQVQPGRTMRVSSCDPDLKNGNRDNRKLKPGKTLTVADIEGPGIIRHIWFTINAVDPRAGRSLVLRMYWDGAEAPAVESPLGDFFAVGLGMRRTVNSQPVAVTSEGRAYNCYWPMPFAKRARITLTNDSTEYRVRNVYYYVDYEKVSQLPPNTAYFHAQYRQEYPAQSGQNYLILDAEGKGKYVGTVLSVYSRTGGWFGEGDDFFYIDGETEPSLRGTGTEDYFCDAWGFRELNRPYYGVTVFEGFGLGKRVSVYRWHLLDPIRFEKSLKLEIEHKGAVFNEQGKMVQNYTDRPDLFSSVAFWYQTGQAKRFTTLPPLEQRVVPQVVIEGESLVENAKAVPAGTEIVKEGWPFGRGQLSARCNDVSAKVTIPFTLESAVQGIFRLKLSKTNDGGIWSIALDGKAIRGLEAVDLYSQQYKPYLISLGLMDLAAGEHILTFECKGRQSASQAYRLGLDMLTIDALTPYYGKKE